MTQDHEDRGTRRRRGKAFWRRALKEQRQSGLTQFEYCRRHDLSRSTFHRWRKRLKKHSTDIEEPGQLEFVSVEVQREPVELRAGFELIFCNGLRLKLPDRVQSRALVEVLTALEVTGSC